MGWEQVVGSESLKCFVNVAWHRYR
jgi:hypothetical protein